MGAGQSDLYKGTYGDNPDNIPDELKGRIELPQNDAQTKHIFRKQEGHLEDTSINRELLVNLANDEDCHIGKDCRGLDWHIKITDDGKQLWVASRNGVIQNGGINNPPLDWNSMTGLNQNPIKRRK